ncbi:PTS sugar transporter subunit IIA [Curtobacterium sp. NPDC090217]|uniref:PTS sugar transporter subunit IIA n=1 Tax=unclassified Curtobacterium TaxID=257496 RepID=UPI0007D72B16|nr:PTS sugar transporter subunit IIA [Curtobacterium sp. 9128]SBN64674.1 PTS system, ascorbate-specific IIA component [Curtobacterium sp. 9128]
MLTELLTPDRIRFADDVGSWRTAITLVSEPLVTDGTITTDYVDAVTESIAAPGGTYIDLGFGFALAHARPERGVVRPGLSYLRVRPAVDLADDPAHPIDVFLLLAATGSAEHVQTMQELAMLLTDEDARTRLLEAVSPADVTSALPQIGQNA